MSLSSTSKTMKNPTITASVKPSGAKSKGKIIAIDDDPMTLRLLKNHLGKAGYFIETAENGAIGLQLVDESTAVALVDLRMPGLDGFELLRQLRARKSSTKVIVLTGSSEISDAVQAMREGAFHFVTKPFNPSQMVVFVEKALESWQVANENRDLKESHCQSVSVRAIEVSGDMNSRLIQQVEQISALDSTVFIGGETGTGKSTIARMIHQKSKRGKGPFVTVNCASLPRDLIQSELFGHTKGAFTGALMDRIGHAEMANGGTLFLDEIGDLPIDLQPKLLTFLQDRTVQRLGSTEAKKVDVRLIAATHCDLAEMCREGHFRQDLYFRLMVLNLELPALRFRTVEFPDIANGILARICERQSLSPRVLMSSAMKMLLTHDWPGNIRELENVLERAIAFSKGLEIGPNDLHFSNVSLNRRSAIPIESHSLRESPSTALVVETVDSVSQMLLKSDGELAPTLIPSISLAETQSASAQSQPVLSDSGDDQTWSEPKPNGSARYDLVGKTLEQIERDAILQTLEYQRGNKAKTARVLGISEKSIYNKMRRLKISL
jgi:DNA-binding NtrC family response regulator